MLQGRYESKVDIYLNDALMVTFTASSDKVVTMSNRPSIDNLTIDQLRDDLKIIEQWKSTWSDGITDSRSPQGVFREVIEKTTETLELTLKINGQWMIRSNYIRSTGVISFLPRPQLVVSMPDFNHFLTSLYHIVDSIQNFS